jgi:osmotically-inducible protein OsmY
MLKAKPMFLSTLQPSATFSLTPDHGISMEKTAIETELSYLHNFDGKDLTVDITGDYIVLEGAVRSTGDQVRALRVAREIVGYDRVLSRIIVCGPAA